MISYLDVHRLETSLRGHVKRGVRSGLPNHKEEAVLPQHRLLVVKLVQGETRLPITSPQKA